VGAAWALGGRGLGPGWARPAVVDRPARRWCAGRWQAQPPVPPGVGGGQAGPLL